VFKRAWRDTEQNTPEPLFRAASDASEIVELIAERIIQFAKGRTKVFSLNQLCAELQGDQMVLCAAEFLEERRDYSLDRVVERVLRATAVPNHPFHVYTDSGLAKRAAWESAWAAQRSADAGGSSVAAADPPEYSQGSRGKSTDFLRTEYWQHRGRLDVPKERFIAFSEVPGRTGTETYYAWAGWTPAQRLKAILTVDEELEDSGIPLGDRIGLLDSAWRLLPDVAREDATAATRLKAELQALVGPDGPSRELIQDWRKRFPPPTSRATRNNRAVAAREEDDSDTEEAEES
jgi:hypothetical protein